MFYPHRSKELSAKFIVNNFFYDEKKNAEVEIRRMCSSSVALVLPELFFKKYGKRTTEPQLWQRNSHLVELFTPKMTSQKQNYLHNNPVLAGFADLPENYLYNRVNSVTF